MAGKSVRVGDLIAIAAAPTVVAVAKVIYVSNRFKNVIGLRVFDCPFDHVPSATELPAQPSYMEHVIYTGKQSVGKDWPIIANVESSKDEIYLTRRLVAGDVYVGDENLGRASEADRRHLHSMGVAGMYAVHDDLARRLANRRTGCV